MSEGSGFPTAKAVTLKPREAKVVRTRGTDNKLVFAERGERVVIKKGVEAGWSRECSFISFISLISASDKTHYCCG